MELSLKIELTDRRSSGESRALFYYFFLIYIYIFYFNFSTENLGGPERGPERGPEGGPEGGSRKGGPRFVYTPVVTRANRANNARKYATLLMFVWF